MKKIRSSIIILFVLFMSALFFDSQNINAASVTINNKKINEWTQGQYNYVHYEVTIKNNSKKTTKSWEVSFLVPNTTIIENAWNGSFSLINKKITVKSLSYNKKLKKNATTSFGIILKSKQAVETSHISASAKYKTSTSANTPKEETIQVKKSKKNNNLVKNNGVLRVMGTKLSNKKGKTIQLKGMSSHGIQWFGNFVNYDSIKYLRDNWGTNVFRIAMYTAENGYLNNKNAMKKNVYKAIDNCIKLDMYVIVDWHILSDGNPQNNQAEAVKFFRALSKKYAKYPNIIYEICNEPNGNVSWKGNIKPYANAVIKAIRKNDKDGIVIVGTPNWSQDVDSVISSPLSYKNVLYSLHFYAGTHGTSLRQKAEKALKNNIPIFVSEWGTSSASGDGGPYITKSKKWVKWMNKYKLSWCSWSLCDKNETSAVLAPGASTKGKWKSSHLSKAGKYIKSIIDARK